MLGRRAVDTYPLPGESVPRLQTHERPAIESLVHERLELLVEPVPIVCLRHERLQDVGSRCDPVF